MNLKQDEKGQYKPVIINEIQIIGCIEFLKKTLENTEGAIRNGHS